MICRLCIQQTESFLNIFDKNGLQLGIPDILGRHFWFKPHPDDQTASIAICTMCWSKVYDFHQFYVMVEQAHAIHIGDDVKKESFTELLDNEFIDPDVSIKEEFAGIPCFLDENNTSIGDEQVNPFSELDSEKVLNNEVNEKDDGLMRGTTKPEVRTSDASVRRCAIIHNPIRVTKKLPKHVTSSTNNRKKTVMTEDRLAKSKAKRSVNSSRHDAEIVKKYIHMSCELCTFISEEFATIRKHFRISHPNIKPFVRCCNKKLFDRLEIADHAHKHEDPEFFKCLDCQKVFSDRYTLRSHRIAAHALEGELNFACDLCPKKFSRKYFLDLHLSSHIPKDERTFICDQCPNSRFASNDLLKIHISMRHRRATNICHVCAKEIRDKAAFEKHVRLHFEDSGPRLKCPRSDCDSWLKDEENLRTHLRRHNDEGQIFTCDECGRICKNRQALRSHMNYVHSNEVFTCEECNKTFKKAISLREHMAQHTGESLYNCPFCTRTFNSNANMHSHKKKMHPIEWDIQRKMKQGSTQQLTSDQQSKI